jgi:hypothetical protein
MTAGLPAKRKFFERGVSRRGPGSRLGWLVRSVCLRCLPILRAYARMHSERAA